jgi:hypothetical protein
MPDRDFFRPMVVARAGGACEYCRLLEFATGVTFHIEHATPISKGGATAFANLALSCPGCNLAKGDRTTGIDSQGQLQSLFNPRDFEPWLLGWYLHFQLDHSTGLLVPRTKIGEATITTLRCISPQRSFARRLQIQAGLVR